MLNGERIDNLQRHGVRNGRLAEFHARSQAQLARAESAQSALNHRTSIDAARRAWAYAAAAYRDVQSTQSGVVQGALFLLAILLPFAHFAERLVFGFPDLRRQVLGYFGLFFLGFLALSQLHPAFELSISPLLFCSASLSSPSVYWSRVSAYLASIASCKKWRAGGVLGRYAAWWCGYGIYFSGPCPHAQTPFAHGNDLRNAGAADVFRALFHIDSLGAAHQLD